MSEHEDVNGTKSAAAMLAACVVETLNDSDESFRARFLEKLDLAYAKRKDDGANLTELETLGWAREMISGFSFITGKGRPYLKS